MTDTTAIVPARQDGPRALVPQNFTEAKEMAEFLSKSSLMPAAMKQNPFNVLATVAAGGELGMAPMAALRAFHVIEGVPRLSADALVAICLARPDVCEYFYPTESTTTRCTWTTKRRGAPAPVTRSWDTDRAQKAGLWGKRGPWEQHPSRQMSARAKAELARDVYPDLCAGLYTPDEDDLIGTVGDVEVFAKPPTGAPQAAAPAQAAPVAETAAKGRPGPKPKAAAEPAPVQAAPTAAVPTPEPAKVAPAALAHYEASAARVAEPEVIDAEIVEPDGFGETESAGDPPELIAFRADIAAAKTQDELKATRPKFSPWSNTAAGKPYGQRMREEYKARSEAIGNK